MTHFVLYARRPIFSVDDVKRIADSAGVTVLDNEIGGALLVDTTPDGADKLRELLPGWVIAEEVEYPPPGLHPHTIKGDKN